ncbi:MAG: lipid kinase [Actinomycetota bacterium]|nr:lipid kinase [Actinomycetota bacterium]
MDGLVLLASSRAGSAEADAVEAARAVLARSYDVEVAAAGDPEALDRALDSCAGRRLVVAGGDGSLHLIVQRLHARAELDRGPLGLIPLGTGNDLARALGLPLDPEDAARVVCAGSPRALDLLVDDAGGVVVNAVHLGLGALAAEAAGRWKRRFGALAYPLGALRAGTSSPTWRLRVTVDADVLADGRTPLLMVGVGNGPGIGGGTPLLPHARPDDGQLDVVAVRARGLRERLAYGVALRRGRHVERDDVHVARGRSVTVEGPRVEVNADGELGESVTRRTWTVQPGAWSLLLP